jgi:hypothetical protein
VITVEQRAGVSGDRWLMLVHQLPAKPAYLRVKIWRRLQDLGAVALKNSVYTLPSSAEAQEDFEWLLREIQGGGGEAMVCETRLVDGMTDADVQALFKRARDADYDEIAKEARELARALGRKPSRDARAEAKARLGKLRARLAQVHAIDFFGANGRETADGLLIGIEQRLQEFEPATQDPNAMATKANDAGDLKGRTWVTRTGVFIDRIGSAWLIHRFIDPEARFKFVPAKGYVPVPGELRFDMFEAEFTHEGDRCTFEVLLGRAGLEKDRALVAIAEIVHDIDLKDGKFGRPEAEGVRTLIAGISNDTQNDEERLARGAALFDDLYRSFPRGRNRARR